MRSVFHGLAALVLAPVLFGLTPVQAGVPEAYAPLVIEPRAVPAMATAPAHHEFDLSAAVRRAQREKKRLYVYLGASDCTYCRRYEAFLAKNAQALVPDFSDYLVVDLRSALSIRSKALYIRAGNRSQPYEDFQRELGDERARQLVYPSVWLLDPGKLKPLMQMPAGTGTFETVEEQREILRLVQ